MSPDRSPQAPRVSVLMSVLDPDPGLLREALASLRDQTLADWELILLEDPGANPVAPVVAEFGDARIRHHRNERRTSLADSRRRAMDLAGAELVAVLDADDVALPERLARQVAFLDAHPEVDVLGTAIVAVRADGAECGLRRYPTDHEAIVAAMPRFNPLAHPTVMVRRSAVLAAGGYRNNAGGTVDDYELWSRMARRGHRFANLAEPLLRYRLHAGSTKSRRLRQTLADTRWVKRTYWSDRLGFRGRLRMGGERLLGWLPAGWVHGLFERLTFRPRRSGGVG